MPYVNTGFKEDEPASTAFLYLMSGVANPSGAVIWASQTSTVKAAPNSGILSFNVQTSADDTPITSFTSGAALAAALASGSVHATKATGFKLRELILYTNSSYTKLDEIKKYRENDEIDLRFDMTQLNRLVVEDGRLPSNEGECVMSADRIMSSPLAVGDTVEHNAFGRGTVTAVQPMSGDAMVTVQFEKEDKPKRLMLKFAGSHMKKL